MKNRDMPAKPIVSAEGFPSHDSVIDKNSCTGLTKLEYAAIQILSGASGNFDFISMAHINQVEWALMQANALFDELEKQ